MNLIYDWRAELNKLWSVRIAILTALLGSADQILEPWVGTLPPVVYSILALLIGIARMVDQK